jgi:hypothetical protein
MARCDVCGENAGSFQSRHSACNTKTEDAKSNLQTSILKGAVAGKTYEELKTEAERIASANNIPFDRIRETVLQAANDATSQIALQAPVTEAELIRLYKILQGFGFDEYLTECPQRRWFGLSFLAMSHILWQALHDVTPFYGGAGRMQFNLQADEHPFFSIGKATFAEERTISTGARTFGGLSVPVGGGVYYHLGASQGHQVSGLQPLDVGEILITSHALYFGGQRRTLHIPLQHVVRYQSYVDGVGVCESHGTPKVFVPDYSGMDTGWFLFNLLSALTSKLNSTSLHR